MRTTLLTLAAILVSGAVWAQTVFNYDNPDFRSKAGFLHVTADSSVFLTGMSWNDFMYGTTRVFRSTFRENSSIEHTDILEGFWGEYPEELSIYGMNNGDFILAARLTGCDYGQPLTVGIFDKYGIPYFDPFQVSLNAYVKPYISLIGDEEYDRLVAISDPYQTVVMTYDGSMVQMIDEVLSYHVQIELEDGFLSAKDAFLELQDTDLNTIHSVQFNEDIIAIDTLANGYLVMTDSIYVLNEDMHPTFKISPDSNSKIAFATSKHVWLIQENGMIHRLSHKLEKDTIFRIPFNCTISDAKHVGDAIHITGLYETPHEMFQIPHEQSRYHIKTDAESFLEGVLPDIDLIDVRIADTVRTHTRPWGPFYYLDIDYGRVYITLHNKGEIPIHDADIKMRLPHCPSICSGAYELTYTLDGLNLGPGEIREYFLDELSFQCAAFQPGQLCMWVAAPNRQPDATYQEEPVCAEVEFITGTEVVADHPIVAIRPNPASDVVFIECESETQLRSYQVLSMTGQNLSAGVFNNKPYNIDLKGLSSGTYVIILSSAENERFAERLVVTR